MAKGFPLIRFIVQPTLPIKEGSRHVADRQGVISGPGVIHSAMDDREKTGTDCWLPQAISFAAGNTSSSHSVTIEAAFAEANSLGALILAQAAEAPRSAPLTSHETLP
jgi:hypothetical protein